jgi:drug/metabolite transporter (DMT)-like permease
MSSANYQKQTRRTYALGMLITSIIWGSTFFISKDCLNDVSAISLVGYRSLFTAIIIAVGLLFTTKSFFSFWKEGLLLGVVLLVSYLGQTVGLNYVTASNSGFITGLFVVLVPLLNFAIWKERLALNSLIAVVIAAVGMWMITGGIHKFSYGDWITFAGATSFALYVLLADKVLKKGADPWVLNFQQFLVISVISFVLALFFHSPVSIGSWKAFYQIVYLAVFAGVIAYGLQLMAQQHLPPLDTTLLMALEPVFGAIFAWTIGGEAFTLEQGIGGLFIVSAIIFSEIPIFNLRENGETYD